MKLEPIYTEMTQCRDCYKCVRVCPVKAIQVQDGSARVAHDRCIFCGKCVDICPAHAKKIRNDVPKVKRLLREKDTVYVSLAPSFVTEFIGKEEQLLKALVALGFAGVSETALGAEIVSGEVDRLLREQPDLPYISTACPTVVEAVRKYYPSMLPSMTPLRSPLGAHSLLLRSLYGKDVGIVFIGPCISKKLEADRNPGLPDAVLTYRELTAWLQERGMDLDKPETLRAESASLDPMASWYGITPTPVDDEPVRFVPYLAGETTNYALENGMIATLEQGDVGLQDRTTGIAGTAAVLESLKGVEEACSDADLIGRIPRFYEMLSCAGGCVNGPGCLQGAASIIKKAVGSRYTRERLGGLGGESRERPATPPSITFQYHLPVTQDQLPAGPASFEIEQALRKLGKADEAERLDCGGCGYSSCRDFAAAWLAEMAEPEMCVTKMRKQAQSKVDMLLRTLPMGVVIVNREYRIVDCNAQFLNLFSSVTYEADDVELGKVSGSMLKRFIDLEHDLSQVFSGISQVRNRKHEDEQRIIEVTLFSIDNRRMAGALFQDTTTITRNRDAVMRRAEAVIQKNLQSVQQIASLLGENAAETEIMLSSMIDVFERPGDQL